MIRIHDLATNEVVDREMTDEEYAQHLVDVAAEEARIIEKAEQAAARQALLNKLGITEEEAQLLLGGNK